ncbi:MAG: hypothetical protein OK422_04200 [Thaumarchaeota archaeon]|nr:hypothetical protein [Nitrososphaerota archaeon]
MTNEKRKIPSKMRRPGLWFFVLVGAVAFIGVGFYVHPFFALSSGPVFGPEMNSVSVACSGNPLVCRVGLQNVGTGDSHTTSTCMLTLDGTTYHCTSQTTTIPAGGPAVTVTCSSTQENVPAGSTITVSFVLSNDGVVAFSGKSSKS